jgi:predicted HNH restriction endonuclease
MLSDIINYKPEQIEFVLDESVKEKFSEVLVIFDKAKTFKEVLKIVNERMTATFPENEIAQRKLDDFEIKNIREEYCLMQENDLPEALQNQLEEYEEAKRMKKAADDRLDACRQRISELAARVKKGTEDVRLKANTSFCIALYGHYLYFTWLKDESKVVLAKAVKIGEWGEREIWSQEDKNRQAFIDLFNIEFPEVKKPAELEHHEDEAETEETEEASPTDSDSEIVNEDENDQDENKDF